MAEDRVYVRIGGDSAGAVRAARQSEEALQQVLLKAESLTRTQVEGDARARQAHQALLEQYRRTAAEAERGSAQQAAALRLVTREERALGVQASESGRHMSILGHELKGVERGAIAGSGAFSHLGRSMAFASTAFLGTAGITQLMRDSIKEATGLNAELHRTDVTFKGSAGTVRAWSKTTADSIGIARTEALRAANQFGAMFTALGVGQRQASQLSRGLVQRAADIGSLRNIDPQLVLDAFVQGIAGRGRALRQYGIVLDATRLKAEALSSGIVRSSADLGKVRDAETQVAIAEAKLAEARTKYGAGTTQVASATLALSKAHDALAKAVGGSTPALTNQQKALAAYRIIMQDSANASGQFQHNSGRLGEQMKVLHAQVKEVEVELGQALIPVVLRLVTHMTDWLKSGQHQEQVQRDLKEAVHLVAGALGALYSIGKLLVPVVQTLDQATGSFKHTMELLIGLGIAKKIGLLSLAFDGLAASEAAAGTAAFGLQANLLVLSVGATALLAKLARITKIGAYGFGAMPDQQTPGTINGIPVIGNPKRVKYQGVWYDRQADGSYVSEGLPGVPGSSVGGATGTSPNRAGVPRGSGYPVSAGLSRGRIDRGVDFSGQGFVYAIADGVVTFLGNETSNANGGGGPFLIYQIAGPRWVYVAEQWTPLVRVGQRLTKGQPIGRVHGHIEIGWAGGPSGTWNTAAKGAKEGEVTAAGQSFAQAIGVPSGGGGGTPAAGGPISLVASKRALVVGKRRGTHAPGLAIVPGKLTSEQEAVANLIYATAIAQGATADEALAMVAAAYAESKLDPRAAGGGLFQINAATNPHVYAAYMRFLHQGYDPTTAAVMAMVGTYIAVGKAHPGATPGEIGALAERPSLAAVQRAGYPSAAAFEGQAIGRIFGFGDSSGYGLGKKPSTAPARKAAVQTISRALPGVLSQLEALGRQGILSPETEAVVHAHAAALRKLITEALKDGTITPAELAAIKAKWTSLATTLKNGIDQAVRAAETAKLVRTLLRAALGDGIITDDELATIDQKLSGLQGKLATHLRALVKTIVDQRAKLDAAWANVKSSILSAFDTTQVNRVANLRTFGADALSRAQAQKTSDRAQGQISSLEAGGLTPVMAAIKEKGDALIQAYQIFAEAMKGSMTGGQTVSADQDQVVRAAGALAEAQNQWDSLSGTWTDTETAYHDAYQRAIDSAASIAQFALDDYQKERETKAQLAKKVVAKQLDAVYADLRSGKITLNQAEKTINDILAPFGLSLADLGNVLDTSDLQDALGSLKDSVDKLTAALTGLGGAAGPGAGPPGPGRPTTGPGGPVVDLGPSVVSQNDLVLAGASGSGRAASFGGGGVDVTVHVNVAGSLVAATPEKIAALISEPMRNELIKAAMANGGDLWGGRIRR